MESEVICLAKNVIYYFVLLIVMNPESVSKTVHPSTWNDYATTKRPTAQPILLPTLFPFFLQLHVLLIRLWVDNGDVANEKRHLTFGVILLCYIVLTTLCLGIWDSHGQVAFNSTSAEWQSPSNQLDLLEWTKCSWLSCTSRPCSGFCWFFKDVTYNLRWHDKLLYSLPFPQRQNPNNWTEVTYVVGNIFLWKLSVNAKIIVQPLPREYWLPFLQFWELKKVNLCVCANLSAISRSWELGFGMWRELKQYL